MAAKTFDDQFYTNAHYAKVGGIPVEELNCLELEFLFNINFSLYVSCEDYQRYHEEIFLHANCGTCSLCSIRLLFICNLIGGMDLPRLYLVNVSEEESVLRYVKSEKARTASPTNVNFDAEIEY